MYFEVFKFIVIFAGYELNPLKQVKYKTIYKMRKVSLALLLCLLCLAGMAQGQKALDLKDITSGRFRPENIQGVIPTPDGEHYTQMNADGTQIIKYSFRTGEKVEVILT